MEEVQSPPCNDYLHQADHSTPVPTTQATPTSGTGENPSHLGPDRHTPDPESGSNRHGNAATTINELTAKDPG
jgi:hypothetical protein